jgi:hypothetical protein
MYVSKYLISRHFGGPEEGGWWFDWWQFKCVMFQGSEPRCQDYARTMKEKAAGPVDGEHDRFSVLGDEGDWAYIVEDRPAEFQSKERPTYA